MPQTILDWLSEKFPTAKKQTLKRMLQARRVTVNGRAAISLKQELDEKDVIAVDQSPAKQESETSQLRIIYEDNSLLVVDKPAGLLTSTVPRERRATLLGIVRQHVERSDRRATVGLIHRLDRDASGLLIFSKSDAAFRSLKQQFFKHTVHREYAAVVHGTPAPAAGRIQTRLVENADGIVYSTKQPGKGEDAVTHYETIVANDRFTLLKVVLETGRKNQIRVHLSERGWPIVGDKTYGREGDDVRLMLAAVKLKIQHPVTGKEMTFEIPRPREMKDHCKLG